MNNLPIIYSAPKCVQCQATYRAFNKKGKEYKVIDISEDEESLNYIKTLGYSQLPVVVVGKEHWSGFNPDMINKVCG